jgi:hypothetical protein
LFLIPKRHFRRFFLPCANLPGRPSRCRKDFTALPLTMARPGGPPCIRLIFYLSLNKMQVFHILLSHFAKKVTFFLIFLSRVPNMRFPAVAAAALSRGTARHIARSGGQQKPPGGFIAGAAVGTSQSKNLAIAGRNLFCRSFLNMHDKPGLFADKKGALAERPAAAETANMRKARRHTEVIFSRSARRLEPRWDSW